MLTEILQVYLALLNVVVKKESSGLGTDWCHNKRFGDPEDPEDPRLTWYLQGASKSVEWLQWNESTVHLPNSTKVMRNSYQKVEGKKAISISSVLSLDLWYFTELVWEWKQQLGKVNEEIRMPTKS